jgi:altronate dehydratase
MAENSPLTTRSRPTISYGEPVSMPGLHVMETPTSHFVEILTGLGATGVDVIIVFVGARARQGHPLVPMIQVGATSATLDVDLTSENERLAEELISLLPRVVSGEYIPKAIQLGNTDFQMTRGLLGVSL